MKLVNWRIGELVSFTIAFLLATITAAARTITALKIRNLPVFDAGTTSSESSLIAPSKLAWKIATNSTLLAVTL